MSVFAFSATLRPESVAEYEVVHSVIPAELDGALRRAGVRGWSIWRDRLTLFHVVDVEDLERMKTVLRGEPADAAWQKRINGLLEEPGWSGIPLGLVWRLPSEHPAAAGV